MEMLALDGKISLACHCITKSNVYLFVPFHLCVGTLLQQKYHKLNACELYVRFCIQNRHSPPIYYCKTCPE